MIVANVVLAQLAPARLVVAALALGNTIGQTVVAIRWCSSPGICGPAAVPGVSHAALAGLAAGAAGAAVGLAVSLAVPCITSWRPPLALAVPAGLLRHSRFRRGRLVPGRRRPEVHPGLAATGSSQAAVITASCLAGRGSETWSSFWSWR